MKNSKNLLSLLFLTLSTLVLTSCLHIVEEVTLRNDNTGNYKMTIDMSEIKSMMDALKDVGGDSTATDGSTDETTTEEPAEENSMADMGEELSGVSKSLRGVAGISNIQEMNDTANYKFGYSFDFASTEALNKAMKVINKEKYDSKVDEVFKFNGKSFERLGAGDLGEEIKKALSENEDAEAEANMDMVKTFFADMTYKQVYHFPDRKVKKSSNTMSEITDDGHTLTIALKPFDEEQQKKKLGIATSVKLK